MVYLKVFMVVFFGRMKYYSSYIFIAGLLLHTGCLVWGFKYHRYIEYICRMDGACGKSVGWNNLLMGSMRYRLCEVS